jgi:hypothetical protein
MSSNDLLITIMISLLFSKILILVGYKGIGFEPQPNNCKVVSKTLALNKLSQNYHLFQNGISDSSYVATMNPDRSNNGIVNILSFLLILVSDYSYNQVFQ